MAKLFHRFLSKKEALPEIQAPVCDGLGMFQQLEWGDMWDCTNMRSVLAYLRGSMDLELGEWRQAFPTEI